MLVRVRSRLNKSLPILYYGGPGGDSEVRALKHVAKEEHWKEYCILHQHTKMKMPCPPSPVRTCTWPGAITCPPHAVMCGRVEFHFIAWLQPPSSALRGLSETRLLPDKPDCPVISAYSRKCSYNTVMQYFLKTQPWLPRSFHLVSSDRSHRTLS